MLPRKPLKLLPLLLASLLLALPASNAHAHYRVTGRDLSKIAKFELKSRMCRAKATVESETPLMEAAGKGDVAEVKRLIAAGANVNDVYGYGDSGRRTALMEAVLHEHADVVKLLIEAKAKLDLKDAECSTALMMTTDPEVIGMLLKAGADWKTKDIEGKSALDQALAYGRSDVLGAFLDAGVRLSSSQKALALSMAACRGRDVELLRRLFKAGAKLSDDALLRAARCGEADTVRFFLASNPKLNVNVRDSFEEHGKTALMWAAENGNSAVVEALIQAGADVNASALSHDAWDRVRYSGGRVKDSDWTGETALMFAVSPITGTKVSPERRLAVVKALIKAGADVNARDSYFKRPPLMWAGYSAPLEVVNALIAAGADLKAKDADGRLAAEMLLGMMERISEAGDVELARKLIAAGADVNAGKYNLKDDTALMLAVKGGNAQIVRMLLDAGADLNAKDYQKQTPLMLAAAWGRAEAMKVLIQAGADPKAVNENGSTLLMMALPSPDFLLTSERVPAERRLEVVKTLIQAGLDVKAVNNDGETALHFAAAGGYLEPIQALLAAGADVDARNKEFITPLMYAAYYGHAEAAKALIGAGAGVDFQSNSCKRPLMYAAETLEVGAVQVLIEAGADVSVQNQKDQGVLELVLAADTGRDQKIDKRKFDIVRALLKAGAEVNVGGIRGQALKIIQAAELGETDKAKALIQALGGNVNASDKAEEEDLEPPMTPLMWAARLGQAEAAKLLIAAGAKVNLGNCCTSPLVLAAEYGHLAVLRLLMESGAVVKSSEQAIKAASAEINRLRDLKMPYDAVFDQKTALERSSEALIAAIRNRHPEAAKLLLAAGADANAEYSVGSIDGNFHMKVLMLAAETDQPELVTALLAAGADPNARIPWVRDDTALSIAVKINSTAAARALIEGGADVKIRYKNGYTVHWLAESEEMKEILKAADKR